MKRTEEIHSNAPRAEPDVRTMIKSCQLNESEDENVN